MQNKKCSLNLYSEFLVASQKRYSGVELSKVSPDESMSHDSVSRFLADSHFEPIQLWGKVKPLVNKASGYLVGDDTLLSKEYSQINELAKKQYSGNTHRLTNGICLVNLLWTAGEEFVPVDYRVYFKEADEKTKNDHLEDMLKKAYKRGFKPRYVLLDAWYSSVSNMKFITHKCGWHFICVLKRNRKVSVIQGSYIPVSDLDLAERQVRKVWLKEYGYVLVCKIVDKDGGITYLATDDLSLTDYEEYTGHHHKRWMIEEFHRGLKQTTGIEKCYSVKASSQRTHIFASFVAFIKLEAVRLREHISWYEQKAAIGRHAIFSYLSANA
jgi:hypothetical protein